MTFGELRLLLSKWAPGVDFDVLDGLINARARRIWERRNWHGRKRTATLVADAAYRTGTVAFTNGSASITGTGTAWTGEMTGMRIRAAASNEWYLFTFVDGTHGTLDRAWLEPTAAAAAYTIYQPLLTLPVTLSSLVSLERIGSAYPLSKRSHEWLNQRVPHRPSLGPPTEWANWPESTYRAELYPAPLDAVRLQAEFYAVFTPYTSTGTEIPEWVSWAAIELGVRADLAGRDKDYAGKQDWERDFDKAVASMERDENRRSPVHRLRLAPELQPRNFRAAGPRRVW